MITISHVSKCFGALEVLNDVSLTIHEGERVAFVGTNGSGKTTLLRILLGLLQFQGRVEIAGFDVARAAHLALQHVAYIPQIAPPIDASVVEVVRAHAQLRDKPREATYARAKRLGLDLGTSGHKRFRDLSGGMKQKLLVAMALAAETPILVCDEPTANLDGDARAAFFREIEERPANSVVILCSHRIEEVRQIVQRVVQFEEGRMVRDAPLSEILRGLKAFRVEFLFRDVSTEMHEALVGRGLRLFGKNQYFAHVAQHEKLEVIKALLHEYEEMLVDMSAIPLEDFSLTSAPAAAINTPSEVSA